VAVVPLGFPDLGHMASGVVTCRVRLGHMASGVVTRLGDMASALCPFCLHYAYLSELCPFDTELASRTTVLTNPTLHCVIFTTDTATWDTKIANYPSKTSYTMPDPCTELTESTLFRLIRHYVASQWYTVQVK
jgi:hypothetical protein